MNTRLALYELAQRHGLDAKAAGRLVAAAGLDAPPASLDRVLARGIAVLAAALVGFGLVLWLAANWDSFGRAGRFALLQAFVLTACVAAAFRPALRAPAGLAALLGIGALFAYFGQTYQTGADAWQLFALWAVLALPLCLAVRSDVTWAPWALVVATAIALWTFTHTSHQWRVLPQDLGAYGIAWTALVMLCAALGPPGRRWTGAGPWAFRTAAVLAVTGIGLGALGGLFHKDIAPHYLLGLLVLAGAAALLARRGAFDLFALSAVALAIDTLLVCGLARLLFEDSGRDPFGRMLLVGLVAAGLLAASVNAILALARKHAKDGSA